jgi:hypothetical protein
MKKISLVLAAITTIIIYTITSCSNASSNSTNISKTDSSAELVNRGKYLVTSIGCDDCHSPKKMSAMGYEVIPELRFSGYPANRPFNKVSTDAFSKGWMTFNQDLTSAAGPWGVSFAANITSDSTGIGIWTEAQFIKALREGKSKGLDGNRPLLPPMPWQNFKNLSNDDLKAIFAFLKTTKPVHNVVPQPIPPQQ